MMSIEIPWTAAQMKRASCKRVVLPDGAVLLERDE